MSPCHPFRPIPGQCGPHRRGPLPAPPFDPRDYWATRKCVSRLSASLETKLDKADVVDPGAATEAGKAADAKSTYEELSRILAKLVKKADKATTLAGYGITDAATKTEIAAKADLVDGKVPAAQLPSYVDDVLEYDTMSAFPATGESGKIYVAKDANKTYRWSGTQYVEISPSPVLDDTVTETSPNGVKSSGIWSWVKSLLPQWLTSDYAEPATAASVADKADEFTEWVASEGAPSDLIGQPYLDVYNWIWERTAGNPYFSDYNTDPGATSLNFSDNGFTATRKRVLRTGDAATPQELIDAISANNPAFVSAVQNTPTSGIPEDVPTDWGTFGTVGAALAAFAAGLKWCKNILGSLASGYSTFAAWIAAKLDRASLLAEYSATSAYSVGAIVYHDGNIYQCKTAIAEGGETWNAEHWELRKLDDFFTESNSLLNGRLAYSRNATGLKDRAFNTLSFDGTEYNLSTALAAVTPTASGQPRDLLIVATATAATTISFTAGTIKGDKPTIDGSGTWLITLTEYASGVWYCRQIKMEDAA